MSAGIERARETRETERGAFAVRAAAGRPAPVARVFPADALTPVTLFRRMRASGSECFLLESVEGGEAIARYTFLGCGPVARLTALESRIEIEDGTGRRPAGEDLLAALRRLAVRENFASDAALPPLSSGAVGFLGYDAVRLLENIPDRHPREGGIPDALFLRFDAIAAFDHARQQLLLLTDVVPDGRDGGAAADEAVARLDRLEAFLTAPDSDGARARTSAPPGPGGRKTAAPRARFLERVRDAQEAIRDGEVYQVVLSQRWTEPLGVDPFDVYRALRMLNPSPYLFYLETREAAVFGASPEMLVRCRGRQVETRPIAGTARRGDSPEEDAELAERLLADPKERAEHVMLVDLSRNDLGRVSAIGSVRVPRYASVEKYSHVQHIVSEVHGELAPGRDATDALAACFPAGTLTGAPKIRAMELIDELEPVRRGVYGGAVGYLDSAGNLDVAIAIRTVVVEDGICRIQAGAGIVADSVPEREYREAEAKAAALFRAVEVAREWAVAR
ncbi:MAG: anthranilate synthase component I [Acidobacteriota bacterium]|nr:anthranilate synthase component I [Acidobacteriota bacterium]